VVFVDGKVEVVVETGSVTDWLVGLVPFILISAEKKNNISMTLSIFKKLLSARDFSTTGGFEPGDVITGVLFSDNVDVNGSDLVLVELESLFDVAFEAVEREPDVVTTLVSFCCNVELPFIISEK